MAETVDIDLGGAKPPDRKQAQPVSNELSNLIRDGLVRGLSHNVHSRFGRTASVAFDYLTRLPEQPVSSGTPPPPVAKALAQPQEPYLATAVPESPPIPTNFRYPRDERTGRYRDPTTNRFVSKEEAERFNNRVPEAPPSNLPYKRDESTGRYRHPLTNRFVRASEAEQFNSDLADRNLPKPPSLPPGYTSPSGSSGAVGGFSRMGEPPIIGKPPVGPPGSPGGIPTGSPLPPPAASGGIPLAAGAVVAVGIAIAAIAIKELADAALAAKKRLDQMAEEYGPYEKNLARAQAFAPITRLISDIRRAERAGPQVATWIDASARNDARFREAVTEAMRPIYPVAADILNKITDILVVITPAIGVLSSFSVEAIKIAIQGAIATTFSPTTLLLLKSLLAVVEQIAKNTEKERTTELESMIEDFLNPGKFITGFKLDRSPSDIAFPGRRGP